MKKTIADENSFEFSWPSHFAGAQKLDQLTIAKNNDADYGPHGQAEQSGKHPEGIIVILRHALWNGLVNLHC